MMLMLAMADFRISMLSNSKQLYRHCLVMANSNHVIRRPHTRCQFS